MAPASLSSEERKRIARLANRNVHSEAVLILTAGFAFLMVCFFILGEHTFLPIAEALELSPTIVWAAISALLSVVWAYWHVKRLRPKVDQAQQITADLLHEYNRKRDAERKLGWGKV